MNEYCLPKPSGIDQNGFVCWHIDKKGYIMEETDRKIGDLWPVHPNNPKAKILQVFDLPDNGLS